MNKVQERQQIMAIVVAMVEELALTEDGELDLKPTTAAKMSEIHNAVSHALGIEPSATDFRD